MPSLEVLVQVLPNGDSMIGATNGPYLEQGCTTGARIREFLVGTRLHRQSILPVQAVACRAAQVGRHDGVKIEATEQGSHVTWDTVESDKWIVYFLKEVIDDETKAYEDVVAFLPRNFAQECECECEVACRS